MAPVELHIDTSATHDLVVHPTAYPPDSLPGDLIAIRPVLPPSSKGKGKDRPLLYKIPPQGGEDDDKGSGAGAGAGRAADGLSRRRASAAVTVSPTLAQAFGWVKSRMQVDLSLIPSPPPAQLCASHVELYFNNLYLSRPDAFTLSLALTDKVLHSGQRVVLPGSAARLRVGDMWSSPPSVSHSAHESSSKYFSQSTRLDSAYLTDSTKFIFRSESARSYIFVEVSAEMWQFEEDGGMLVEKCEMFLVELFAHYSGRMSKEAEDKTNKGVSTSHVVSIILYGRVIYDDEEEAEEERAPLCRLANGTLYRDFYKVLLDLSPSPPASIIHTVALELRRWQQLVLLRTRPDGLEKLSGRLASAHESPVLEATNLALNSFEEHWIDRDLHRTGLEVIVLTAGSSFYEVDKALLRLTTERMLFHGIALDLISLSKLPLHAVPLFQFRGPDPNVAEETWVAADEEAGAGEELTIPGSSGGGEGTTGNKLDAVFSTSNSIRASLTRHPPHLPPTSSLRNRPAASPLLRDTYITPNAAIPSTPLSITTKPGSMNTSSGGGTICSRPVAVPDDQRDPLYFDPPTPAPRPSQAHTQSHTATSSLLPSSPSPSPTIASAPLESSLYYSSPLFVFPHFFGTQPDKPHRIDRFMPRARCYELFSQGVGERVPVAVPFLRSTPAFAGEGEEQEEGKGDPAAGYLTEMEKRMRRREAYDAQALGVADMERGEGGIVIGWDLKESGTSARGASGVSLGGMTSESCEDGMRSAGGKTRRDRRRDRDADRADRDAAIPGRGIEMAPAVVLAAAPNEASSLANRRRRQDSISTTSSTQDERDPAERGRHLRRSSAAHIAPLPSTASGGRSKTPVPLNRRRERSNSAAASTRTVSSAMSRADPFSQPASSINSSTARKASTPALIARLTSAASSPHPPPSASSPSASISAAAPAPNTSTLPLPRPSWLNLFSRPSTILSSASSSSPVAPASSAPTAVARVDVQAIVKPATELSPSDASAGSADSPLLSALSTSERPEPATSRTRANSRSGPAKPTQPISIDAKGESERAKGSRAAAGGGGTGNGRRREAAQHPSQAPQQLSGSLKVFEPGAAMKEAFAFAGSRGRVSGTSRFNPSKPEKRSVGLADQARRWAGILVVERRNMRLGVKWRSITRGACLPITTDYLPSAESLQSQYSEYRYSVPTSSVASSFLLRTDHPKRSHVLTLVTELICQRLSHGFQICTPASAADALDAINLPDVLRDIQDGEVTAVYLSLSNQIHRIWYDRRSQSVFVKVLRRRRTWAKPEYPYQPLIWTQEADKCDVTRLSFPYPVMIDPVEWQHADRLVAGAEKPDASQSVRYRRTRLVLLPASRVPDREFIISRTKALQMEGEEVSDQLIQDQGFYTLMDSIENARWVPAGVEKEQLPIHHTTLDAPGWASSVAKAQANGSVTSSPSLSASQQLPARPGWLSRMQNRTGRDEPPTTPTFDRDLELPPVPTPSREVAAAISRSDAAATKGSTEPPAQRTVVQMTHAVVLDLDPSRRSDRAERVLCHLDRSHNVQAAYHLELAWLTASGKVVDTAIQSWTRQMARYGLTLVEVSMRPVLARHNPFRKASTVRPAVPPPSTTGGDKPSHQRYLSGLLRHLDFVLDLGADSTFPADVDVQYSYRRTPTLHSQFIHRSGAVLVSILADDDDDGPGFAYAPNRIFTSHHPEVDEKEPVRRLVELCEDEGRLKEFWQSVKDDGERRA
ncbi:hypothetical protein JCM21900_005277 [Sporobolomyces salmonicolor]